MRLTHLRFHDMGFSLIIIIEFLIWKFTITYLVWVLLCSNCGKWWQFYVKVTLTHLVQGDKSRTENPSILEIKTNIPKVYRVRQYFWSPLLVYVRGRANTTACGPKIYTFWPSLKKLGKNCGSFNKRIFWALCTNR